jgi:hypothetical protein
MRAVALVLDDDAGAGIRDPFEGALRGGRAAARRGGCDSMSAMMQIWRRDADRGQLQWRKQQIKLAVGPGAHKRQSAVALHRRARVCRVPAARRPHAKVGARSARCRQRQAGSPHPEIERQSWIALGIMVFVWIRRTGTGVSLQRLLSLFNVIAVKRRVRMRSTGLPRFNQQLSNYF